MTVQEGYDAIDEYFGGSGEEMIKIIGNPFKKKKESIDDSELESELDDSELDSEIDEPEYEIDDDLENIED